jgi:hypothetical protein
MSAHEVAFEHHNIYAVTILPKLLLNCASMFAFPIKGSHFTFHHYDNRSDKLAEHLRLCHFRHPTYEDGVVD